MTAPARRAPSLAVLRLRDALDAAAAPVLTTSARAVFAGVLLVYYWRSAMTKLGDGPFGWLVPSDGAYVQIFPRAMEAAGYDPSRLSALHWAAVVAGTWAEFVLPLLLVLGLCTRLAAVGMIGFVAVQSLTDIVGHGTDATTIGAWFDRVPDALILDQRAFWVLALLVLVFHGAGPLSLDRALFRSAPWGRPAGPRR